MEEYKVLITTSGIGSRLGTLTDYTNKSLIRIGKKPSISYIIESYPDDVEFVITLGYFGNHVRDFLELTYPNKKITFVNVENYNGDGSSLAYSLLCTEDYLKCPFIFHASDTIIFEKIPPPMENWLGFTIKEDSSQYRTIDIHNNKIYDKEESLSNFVYIGLCGIKNYLEFWNFLKQEYNKDKFNKSLTDCDALNQLMKNNFYITPIEFKTWMDVGNISSLKKSREIVDDRFEILDKNDESIFIFDDFVIKFFYDKTICKNRIDRSKNLGSLVPKILDSRENFYKYEYSVGNIFSDVVDENKFIDFLYWSMNKLWKKKDTNESFNTICEKFYFEKTYQRVNKYLTSNNIIDTEEIINGFKVPPIFEMLENIDKNWLCTNTSYQFHGDYILDNIIYQNDGSYKLIDWRQDFGGEIQNGDIYYDLAKLNHNLIFNHNIVKDGNFFVNKSNNQIRCDILRSNNLLNCQTILHNFILKHNFDLKKVQILTSIVWLNMSPLHENKISNFLFYFGKLNLYKILNNG